MLERDINNPEAREKLSRMNNRVGMGRHSQHIGAWVIIDGVRNSYRGFLLGVTEVQEGAILHLHPCIFLDSLESTTGEIQMPSTVECPWDIYSSGILTLGQQPPSWPRDAAS